MKGSLTFCRLCALYEQFGIKVQLVTGLTIAAGVNLLRYAVDTVEIIKEKKSLISGRCLPYTSSWLIKTVDEAI